MKNNKKSRKFKSKIMCRICQQETWHIILNEIENNNSDEEGEMWENNKFLTLQCLGCENVCLLTQYVSSENIDANTGNLYVQENISPAPYKNDREIIERVYYVPKIARTVYEETIKAFNSGMMILAAIGIRTTIEAIAIEEKIKVRGIKTKIKKMENLKIITPAGVTLLLLVKDFGNLATHEIKKHHRDDLSLCIDIIEGVFRSLYILPKQAEASRQILDRKWKRV